MMDRERVRYVGAIDPARQHLRLAIADPERLLEQAVARWRGVESYRVTLLSQERLNNRLGALAVIEANVLNEPYAVSFRWRSNAGAIDRLLWMPSIHGQELIVHPTGIAGKLVAHVRVDPTSAKVRNSSRRDVTRFGLAQTLQTLLDDYRRGAAEGNLTSECLGLVACPGAEGPAIGLKRTTSDRRSEARVMLVYLSARDLRPLRVQQFGWQGQLLGSYDFTDYRPVQLSAADFALDAVFSN